MKNFLLSHFIFSLLFSLGNAQVNLIPNPSFETYDTCPTIWSQFSYVSSWFNPTNTTPDYYNTCSDTMGIPSNIAGYQYAKTGVGYAGIIAIHKFQLDEYREYVEVKLDSPLVVNNKYCIQFFVSLADSCNYATDNIGAFLSSDSIVRDSFFFNNLPYIPQIINSDGNFITDKNNWTLVSGEYIAQGGEIFLTIGNFKDNLNTNIIFVGGGGDTSDGYNISNYAYYYLDDVSVKAGGCSTGNSEFNSSENIKIFPSGSKGIYKINFGNSTADNLVVHNILGQQVFSLLGNKSNSVLIDLSHQLSGIYFLTFQIKNRLTTIKIFLNN